MAKSLLRPDKQEPSVAERVFPIETVLSCVALYKIENNIPIIVNDAYLANLLAFMGKTDPLAYFINRLELIAAASICGLILVKQCPSLGETMYPYAEYEINPDHFNPWMANVRSSLGVEMTVQSAENFVPTEAEHVHLLEVNRTLRERFNL
jgi:hypothetical protein